VISDMCSRLQLASGRLRGCNPTRSHGGFRAQSVCYTLAYHHLTGSVEVLLLAPSCFG
jgi:hypothetical protein